MNTIEMTVLPLSIWRYVAGRVYYFRVPSATLCADMAKDFGKRAQKARRDAVAKSRFEKNQEKVRSVFNSTPFQCTVAALIFAVRVVACDPGSELLVASPLVPLCPSLPPSKQCTPVRSLRPNSRKTLRCACKGRAGRPSRTQMTCRNAAPHEKETVSRAARAILLGGQNPAGKSAACQPVMIQAAATTRIRPGYGPDTTRIRIRPG